MIKIKSNLILIGYRGCGKSTIAQKLKNSLNLSFFHSDMEVEKKLGMKIKEFIELKGSIKGWQEFRKIEYNLLKEQLELSHKLLDLGGGAITYSDLMNEFKKKSIFCLIDVSLPILLKRLESDKNRPPLKPGVSIKDETKSVLASRKPFYEKYADFSIHNDGDLDTIDSVVEKLVKKYKEHLFI